jgi:hypothetical protein
MDELNPHIFPTTSRDKLGKAVSFTLGAENLSRALEDVPQHNMITCSFYAGDVYRDLHRPIVHVMHVMYRRAARSFHHGKSADVHGVFDPKWSITVFAVPSTLRNGIKTSQVTHELPNVIRPWLIENADIATRTGECSLVLEYITADKIMRCTKRNALQPDRA